MYLVLGLLVVIVTLYFIALPFLEYETTSVSSKESSNLSEEERKEIFIKSLEELETDFRMKKINKEDYNAVKEEIYKEAGTLLKNEEIKQ